MFDDRSNLSSEIEWMLSSTQAEPAEVRRAVAQEYGTALYSMALSLLIDPELASAAFAEILAVVPANRHRFSPQGGIRNWLYGLVVEVCRRYRGRSWRPWTRSPNLENDLAGLEPVSPVVKRATGVNHQVWEAVDHLGEDLRTPLLLSIVHHLPSADIARILHLDENQVNARLLRARQKLYQRLRKRLCQLRVEETRRRSWVTGWEHLRARDFAQAKLSGIPLSSVEFSFLNEHLQGCAACRAHLVELGELEALLERSLRFRVQTFGRSLPVPEKLLEEAEAGLDQRRKRVRILGPLQQLAFAGIVIVAVLAFGGLTNRLFPRSAALLPQVIKATRLVQVRVTQMVTPTPPPTPQPLTEASTVNEIRLRMVESSRFWHTLWADGLILRYGPAGYIGPPQVYRNQVWFEQPDRLMVLSGQPARAENVTFKLNNNIYEMDLRNGLTFFYEDDQQVFQRLYGPQTAFSDMNGSDYREFVDGSTIQKLLSPQWVAQRFRDLRVVGREDLSTGDLLIVEGSNNSSEVALFRLWLDPMTGVALRWQRFDPQDPSTVTDEVILNQLVYNAPFPEQSYSEPFFSPERFKWDNEWKPDPKLLTDPWFAWAPAPGRSLSLEAMQRSSDGQILIRPSAPWQINLSQSRLTFRWDFHWDRGREIESVNASRVPDRSANLFSGKYFLGRAELGNPWFLACKRSPDGQRITFNEGLADPFNATTSARWLDLHTPEESHLLLTEGSLVGNDAAFSPDSQSLAFWGCGGSENNCGVYIQNLQTGKNRKLTSTTNSAFFQWSPDGQYLAMIRQFYPAGGARPVPWLDVLRVSNGETVYGGDYDWQEQQAQVDAPIHTWGVPFPPKRTGLEGCIAAP